MPTRLNRRIAAPLLVLTGAALFGVGAGGIAGVDAQLEAATQPRPQPAPLTAEEHLGVRGDRPHSHHGKF